MDPKIIAALGSQVPTPGALSIPPGPNPTLAEVLYQPPNPGGSPKACANCFLWVNTGACLIHGRKLKVGAKAVCGYHVFGQPQIEWLGGCRPVDPKLSGIMNAPGGVSCDACTHYEPLGLEGGLCLATSDLDGTSPGHVDSKGCCARFRPLRIGEPMGAEGPPR